MKKYLALCLISASACLVQEGDQAEETESELTPRTTFTRTIPVAPTSVSPVQWTPGMALVPAGYTPRSFHVVYVGKQGTTDRVEAAGFDVAGSRMLFWVEMATTEVDGFFDEVHGSITLFGLQRGEIGIAGNVTPKCCILPGNDFGAHAWGTAFIQYEANVALYR